VAQNEWGSEKPAIMAFERPTVAYYLAQQIIASRRDISTGQQEYDWGTSVFEACKQALHHQDELIADLQKHLTDYVMLRPPAPIIVERENLQELIEKEERRRQWFGDPISAFCGGVLGFIFAAMIACIIWRLSV